MRPICRLSGRAKTVVGETTSGAWGHRVGTSIALGVVRADLAQPGQELEVEIFRRALRRRGAARRRPSGIPATKGSGMTDVEPGAAESPAAANELREEIESLRESGELTEIIARMNLD